MQHSARERNVSPHFLLLGKLFGFLRRVLHIAKIIREQATSAAFKKIALAPQPSRKADIKRSFLPAFEARNDFFGRCGETKTARKIFGRAERKNA